MIERDVTLSDGSPVVPGYDEIEPSTGMQKGYVVLSEAERAKGFVRPVRRSYQHVGEKPKYPVRDLTPEEHERYDQFGYIKYEAYPPELNIGLGRFWTAATLRPGCGSVTTMGQSIAETYAREPKFYGATFCCCCGKHLPVAEFVWDGTDERVGS